jgi:MFS family permease
VFRNLWLATVASNIGTWMHEVGAGWLMVTLDPSPLMVSLVQASTVLPIFFLSVPAGTLADLFDRRVYLIAAQVWMFLSAALLATIALLGWVGPWSLLAFSFALAAGAAMMTPAWAASVPELVPVDELPAAIALNSMGVNISRAIGPAVAGVLVAASGPAIAFVVNAVSFLAVIVVLVRWRRRVEPAAHARERFFQAIGTGLRYVKEARQLQRVMARSLGFFIFATATWSLLPLVAASTGGDSRVYGVMLGAIGAGAVAAALIMPHVRSTLTRDALVRAGTVTYALAMLVLALADTLAALVPAMLLTGAAWLSIVSTLHVSAQTAVASRVRARALSVYLVAYSVGMTVGSVLWGAVAARVGIHAALAGAAAGALLGMGATWRVSLESAR